MHTELADWIRNTPEGDEAAAILSACVHCGFCTATCPTFQLLGNELDGPRGRIDLIKNLFEGGPASNTTTRHLDRCLTCRSCETTCPSGVRYGRLAEIGREQIEKRGLRNPFSRLFRSLLVWFLQTPAVFGTAVRVARFVGGKVGRASTGSSQIWNDGASGEGAHRRLAAQPLARRVLLLEGCAQPTLLPQVNAATSAVLNLLGFEAFSAPKAGCCGALRLHLGKQDGALNEMRRNIDAWWPYADPRSDHPVEAILMTASGCGMTVKEYGQLLRNDPVYHDKAVRIAALTKDLSEWLAPLSDEIAARAREQKGTRQPAQVPSQVSVAFQSPCSLQHGQQLRGQVEQLLSAVGCEVRIPVDSHLCCGSAGTYSILQPRIAGQLRAAKLRALEATHAAGIVSANVGCICYLQRAARVPVQHWIEVVAERLGV